jgi:UDP-N-acetylmuramoyl-tripeptide--D-alanyl-D-alanine ligase
VSPLWTGQEIALATGGAVHGDFSATGVAFDSREIGPGDLFIAMKGEATDGHKFLDRALPAEPPGRSYRRKSISRTSVSRTRSRH